MILFNKLPEEIESHILWLSVGGKDLDIYKKKKNVNTEINLYKTFKKQDPNIGGVYLKPISDYKKYQNWSLWNIYMEVDGYCPNTELQSENTTRNSNISLENIIFLLYQNIFFLIN